MAASTFGDVWRAVRLNVPVAPPLLIQQWVLHAYRALAGARGWGFLSAELTLTARASHTITMDATQDSTTILSTDLVAADAGRQLQVGGVTWTVQSVVPGVSAILDQAWRADSATALTATILDAYLTCPTDFARFTMVVDPDNQRQLAWWVTEEELQRIDPTRAQTGTPRILAARPPSSYTPTLGQVQYEWWPRPVATTRFPARYIKRPDTLADATPLPGVLATRPDVLEMGALARAAAWPGTPDQPNPYFNLALARDLKAEFQALHAQVDLRDDDQIPQSWETYPWHRYSAWQLASSDLALRASDAPFDY